MSAEVRVCACKSGNGPICVKVRRYRRACASVCVRVSGLCGGNWRLFAQPFPRREPKENTKRGKRDNVRFGLLANKPFGWLPSGLTLLSKPDPQFAALLATAHPLCIIFGTVLYLFADGREMRTGVGYRPPGQACRGCTGAVPANRVWR